MSETAGQRLKNCRERMGLTREQFCKLTGINYSRLNTVERDQGRMSVEDLALVDLVFHDITSYVIHGSSKLNLDALAKSENPYVVIFAASFRLDDVGEPLTA